MPSIKGISGGGSSPHSHCISTTYSQETSSPTSITGVSSTAACSLPKISPLTPDVLERGEHEQQLQPYTRKISSKQKVNGSSNIITGTTSSSTRRTKSTSPTSVQQQKQYNILIKYGSLLLLVGQMVGLVLLMRYSRTHTNGDELYLASTAVFMMEVSNQKRKKESEGHCFGNMGFRPCHGLEAKITCFLSLDHHPLALLSHRRL